MKVKPMINGVEVKVGQMWADVEGRCFKITFIHANGMFECCDGVVYNQSGEAIGYGNNWDAVQLIKAVETTVQPKATFTESEINAKINQVIKEFDWQKAASVYTALNWTWYTTQGIPTVGDLVVVGIEHMKQAVQIAVANQKEGYVNSGGLIGRAYIMDGELAVSLEMQVTEAGSGY